MAYERDSSPISTLSSSKPLLKVARYMAVVIVPIVAVIVSFFVIDGNRVSWRAASAAQEENDTTSDVTLDLAVSRIPLHFQLVVERVRVELDQNAVEKPLTKTSHELIVKIYDGLPFQASLIESGVEFKIGGILDMGLNQGKGEVNLTAGEHEGDRHFETMCSPPIQINKRIKLAEGTFVIQDPRQVTRTWRIDFYYQIKRMDHELDE